MPQLIQVKSMLNKTKPRDPWFLDDYTINPYRGCSFNCLYSRLEGSVVPAGRHRFVCPRDGGFRREMVVDTLCYAKSVLFLSDKSAFAIAEYAHFSTDERFVN